MTEENSRGSVAVLQEVDAELHALWSSVARVLDLVLDWVYGTSSLAVSLSSTAKLLEDHIDTVTTSGVCWGYMIGIGCHPVTLPGVRGRAGATWIWAQCRPDRGSGGCFVGLGLPGLRLTGVICSSFDYLRLS
jgi:hypothetical protein